MTQCKWGTSTGMAQSAVGESGDDVDTAGVLEYWV